MENQTRKPRASQSSAKQGYLLAYNAVCLVLWSIVTLQAILLIPTLLVHDKLQGLLIALFPLLKFTQTLALLEILHAVFRLVRASPVTTAIQVASRILVVWGVLELYPQVVETTDIFGRSAPGPKGGPLAFAGILLAWGITECIRYGFFVWREGSSQRVPWWLTWLRYNTFYVLYPLGISSECWLLYVALGPAEKDTKLKGYDLFLKAMLLFYIPGSYIMYMHMMSQRKKVLKGKDKGQ
jgi:very-long-chain (3R)-3-hydroxyacyl-CoA dehydratase